MFFLLGTLIIIERVALWHVMSLTFLSGCVRAFDRPSRMALLPQMVPKEDIPNAVAVGGTIWQFNRLLGPAVAGMLIYLLGIGATYYCCFCASLIAVLLVAWFSHARGKARQAILGAIAFGLLLIAFAFSVSFPLSLILALALGVTSQFYMTIISAILQMNLPNQLRGRVMGIYGLTWDLMPIGGMIAGAIAEFAGAPMAVGVGGFMVAGIAVAVMVCRPNIRRLEQ